MLTATLLAMFLATGLGVEAQQAKTITTAVPLLLIAPDSRGGAMGDAGVAVANDANAMHWNTSALGFVDNQMGFSMSYSPWLRALGIPDINLMYLSGFYNTGNSGVAGASLRYFSLGEIQLTDQTGQNIGTEKPSEFALDVGYALRITPVLSSAITLRYIHSRLGSTGNITQDGRAVNTVAGDISFFYQKDFKLNVQSDLPVRFTSGINISNIGPKVSYTQSTVDRDFIPTNLRVGYAFKFYVDEYNSVTFTNDFNKLLVPSEGGSSDIPLLTGVFGSFSDAEGGFGEEVSEINTSLGFEYWYRELFAARAGFFYEDPLKGNRKYITIGAGLKYNVFGLDFTYLAPLSQNHPLQNTLRFSISYLFESAGNE
ncbi:MAG: type IX secretion system outer membrane channel protein PorV [Bacteroidia bacterium]